MTLADAHVVAPAPGVLAEADPAPAGDPGAAMPAAARGWEAALEIGFVAMGGATILLRHGQRGPLAVQRPFSPEGREVSHVTLCAD